MLTILLLVYAIYILTTNVQAGKVFTAISLLVVAVISFTTDLGLKKWVKNYKKIFMVELIIILMLIINVELKLW